MRVFALLVLFAPIRLCAWGRPEPDPWRDTWREDTFREENPPVVYIEDPDAGQLYQPGAWIRMLAIVEDWDDWPGGIVGTWSFDGDVVCEPEVLADDWSSECVLPAPGASGTYTIRFEARDSMGNIGEASTTVEVALGRTPSVVVSTPIEGSEWAAEAPIPLVATVADEDGLAGLEIVWIVDEVRRNDVGARVGTNGVAVGAVVLDAGPHVVRAEVSDPGDLTATSPDRAFTVVGEEPEEEGDTDAP